MELYRSAASLEHPGAMYNLSVYYGQGRGGLARDTGTATRLLRLAALKGQENAIKALKRLNIPASETQVEVKSKESWTYSYSPYAENENVVPMQSSLFVDSKHFLPVHNCEATVY